MSPEPLCPLSWSPPWSWPSFWEKSSGPVSSGSGLSRPGPQIQRRVPGHHWKLRPVVGLSHHGLPVPLGGLRRVPQPGPAPVSVRRLAQPGFALLLSEVAAGPAAVLGCLIICLPLCLAKGLGIRRMGRSLPPWPWEGCGNRFLGYEYQAGALTVFFSWGAEAWLLLAGVLLGLAATLLLAPPAGRKAASRPGPLSLAVLGFLLLVSRPPWTCPSCFGFPTLGSSRIAIWQRPWSGALGSGPPAGPDFPSCRGKCCVDAAHLACG